MALGAFKGLVDYSAPMQINKGIHKGFESLPSLNPQKDFSKYGMPNAGTNRGIGQVIKDRLNNQSQVAPATPTEAPATTPAAPIPQASAFGKGQGQLRGDWASQYSRQEAATNRAAASNANLGLRDAVQRTENAGFSMASDIGQRNADSAQAIAGSQRLDAVGRLGDYRSNLLKDQRAEARDLVQNAVSEKQRQFLASVAAQGGDLAAAMAATQNPDGTLKAEFQDPSAAQIKVKGMVEEIMLANPNMTEADAQAIAVKRLQAEQSTAEQAAIQQQRQADFQTSLDKAIQSGDFGFISDNIMSMDEAQKSKAISAMKTYARTNKLNADQFKDGVPQGYEGLPVMHNGKVYILTRASTTDGLFEDSKQVHGIDPESGEEVKLIKEEQGFLESLF